MVRVLLDVAFAAQGELGVAVNNNVMLPALISAALGVYVAVVNEFALANDPVPFGVDHVMPELFVEVEPAVILTAPEPEQVLTAVPATAVGAPVMVIVLDDVALAQPAFPVAVNTIVRLPAVISAALGA
jgi:hypothetical protein